MRISELDAINQKLLELLEKNAKSSYSELAGEVGLSRVAVRNRITMLEEMGVIKGYTIRVLEDKQQDALDFVVIVEPRAESYDYVVGILAKTLLIRKVQALTGTLRILAFGSAPNKLELDACYRRIRGILTDVRYFSFDIIASTYKDVDGGITYERREKVSASDAGGTDL